MMNLDYLEKNKEITNLSNFKTKAFTKYYFEIHNRQDVLKLKEIYDFSLENNLDLLFIWWGTNVLFAFDEFNWIVVNNCLNWWEYNPETKILSSYSNESISDIASSLENDLWQELWHRFIWLPGSIWWAVFWNAWCFWLETENNFLDAEVYNYKTWQIEKLWKNEMEFEYRNSKIKKDNSYFIIEVKFDLSKKVEKYSSDVDNIDFRENKQPKWNTCWSFFKNPSKEYSAWFLIESVWLKWYNKWWAFFSDLHANFLMSDWTATYKDLINMISLAQNKVKQEKDIDLVSEVRIIFNK